MKQSQLVLRFEPNLDLGGEKNPRQDQPTKPIGLGMEPIPWAVVTAEISSRELLRNEPNSPKLRVAAAWARSREAWVRAGSTGEPSDGRRDAAGDPKPCCGRHRTPRRRGRRTPRRSQEFLRFEPKPAPEGEEDADAMNQRTQFCSGSNLLWTLSLLPKQSLVGRRRTNPIPRAGGFCQADPIRAWFKSALAKVPGTVGCAAPIHRGCTPGVCAGHGVQPVRAAHPTRATHR